MFASRPPRQTAGAAAPGRLWSRVSLAEATAMAGLLFVVLFWRLGATSFWDPDEAHYAQTTRELIATGDWWAPYYNQQPFFDKPVFFHQLQALSMLAVGENELGARLVPALAALALVIFTGWFGARMVSPDVGLVGALLLAANPGVFGLARYAILDTLFNALLFSGVGLVAIAALRDRPSLQWPGYVLIAGAAMVKGPLAFALSGLAMALSMAMSQEVRRRLLRLRWMTGLFLALAIAAPWFVYMYLRFRGDFIAGYLLDENLRLFAADRFPGQPGPFFYFRILAVGMLPWTGIVIGRAIDKLRGAAARRTRDDVEVLLWAWSIAVIGFFSLSRFKLDHYVFAAAPTLCLICARAWTDVHASTDEGAAPEHAATRIGVYLVGPLLVVTGAAAAYFLLVQLNLPAAAMLVPTIIVGAGVLTAARIPIGNRRPLRVPWIPVAGLTAVYAGIVLFVIPALERQKVVPDIAHWVRDNAGADTQVCSYQLNRWNTAFRFYVGRHVIMLDDPNQMAALVGKNAPLLCVMPQPGYEELVGRGMPVKELYAREGMWVTSGRVLWRRGTPPTRFVVVTGQEGRDGPER